MGVFVGLDCGGSSSRVLALNERGEVLFRGQGGAANLLSVPEDRLRDNLGKAATGCPAATQVCGCFAGLVGDRERSQANRVLQDIFLTDRVRSEPDFVAAYRSFLEPIDVCVIAGTGSLVCSYGAGGMRKTGGGGYLLGDAGSAYQYGRAALRNWLRAPFSQSSRLGEEVEAVFGTREPPEVIERVYRSPTPGTLIARLSRAFAADLESEAPYALRALGEQSAELAELTGDHFEGKSASKGVTIGLAGGLWKGSPRFATEFARAVSRLIGVEPTIVRSSRPPVFGAVALAMEGEHFGN